MKSQNTITRRDFFKLNVLIGGALVLSATSPKVAAAVAGPDIERSLPVSNPHTKLFPITRPITLYGTPTDIALSRQAEVWAIVDAEHAMRFDRAQRIWASDESVKVLDDVMAAVDADRAMSFPQGSRLYLARWGRPNAGYQQLLVIAPAVPHADL